MSGRAPNSSAPQNAPGNKGRGKMGTSTPAIIFRKPKPPDPVVCYSVIKRHGRGLDNPGAQEYKVI
ncbi:hypothetical protein C7T94_08175 [Pedobacter yulinensis]|uniref:Uncharacterized protein n=1 Tax=Pedobacter yulinensis TaxID=2126353 RepID=A0A2T3HJR9_9SPHI|nr:hypothetical protein C7T94_08175 [Pedobacter yulinensis]